MQSEFIWKSLSPLDGRYADKCSDLRPHLSEWGLMKYRVKVEVMWLETMCALQKAQFPKELNNLWSNFDDNHMGVIKQFEKTTNHDVKAVEYFIQAELRKIKRAELIPWVHFGCTSEDINNLSYSLALKEVQQTVILPMVKNIFSTIATFAKTHKKIPMLSRTHGQPASPTTVGKEFANVGLRIFKILQNLSKIEFLGKMNGAVGNYNAHAVADASQLWIEISKEFVEKKLGLRFNPLTTQIEPHDEIARWLNQLKLLSGVFLDLSADCWLYIMLDYFNLKKVDKEVGSSTMPHKVNPIDFENAEGNFTMALSLMNTLSDKLVRSRLQRDLSDSTVLRNLGITAGYFVLATGSLAKGLGKISPNVELMEKDLNDHPEVLTEAVQTVLRTKGVEDAYERLKTFSRGQKMTKKNLDNFIDQQKEFNDAEKKSLKQLTPLTYIGFAPQLVDLFLNEVKEYL